MKNHILDSGSSLIKAVRLSNENLPETGPLVTRRDDSYLKADA